MLRVNNTKNLNLHDALHNMVTKQRMQFSGATELLIPYTYGFVYITISMYIAMATMRNEYKYCKLLLLFLLKFDLSSV